VEDGTETALAGGEKGVETVGAGTELVRAGILAAVVVGAASDLPERR